MQRTLAILVAEADHGHAPLVNSALRKAAFPNPVIRFCDGKETLDYLFSPNGPIDDTRTPVVLPLDIRMPRADGTQMLRRIRERNELDALPVIMVMTTDDPRGDGPLSQTGVQPLNGEAVGGTKTRRRAGE